MGMLTRIEGRSRVHEKDRGDCMSRRRVTVCLIAFLGLVVLIPASMWAQAYSSSLTGLVTDPSGAAVPAVAVKLTDVNKGYDYTAQSNESGRYLLRSLPPGTYRLTATATGFKASVQEGIVLNVDVNTNLDVHLEVGSTQESVQVIGEAPLLSTQEIGRASCR